MPMSACRERLSRERPIVLLVRDGSRPGSNKYRKNQNNARMQFNKNSALKICN